MKRPSSKRRYMRTTFKRNRFQKITPNRHWLVADDGWYHFQFGHSVSISGEYAIVGARLTHVASADDQVMAYIFRRSGQSWVMEPKLIASGIWSGSAYIYSVYPLLPVEQGNPAIPRKFDLGQNYPNPFNAATTISYQLPRAGQVSLTIYNILGQRVKELASGKRSAGAYNIQWDGTDQDGVRVSSGVYLYRLKTDSSARVRKLVLLR
jgi:hypothetical protein